MAIDIALRLGAEIVSVDSMMLYRGMDVGTAKPTHTERRGVPHHMIDIADPSEEFSVAAFRRLGRRILNRGSSPFVIVGGSGLHFRALVDPMSFAPTDEATRAELEGAEHDDLVEELLAVDRDAGRHVDLANQRRVVRAVEIARLTGETPSSRAGTAEAEDLRRYVPEIEFTAIGVDPGEDLDRRIHARLASMRSGGLVDEVTALQGEMGRTAANAVGYREILGHLEGRMTLDQAFESIGSNTRQLARRQRTWFQRDPRIRWIPWIDEHEARVDRAMELLT